MKNDNDLILERLRGVPMREGTWKDKFDPRYPLKPEANDNELPTLRNDPPNDLSQDKGD